MPDGTHRTRHLLDRPRPPAEVYTAAEVAAKLGLSLDRFRRHRDQFHILDGMPREVRGGGRRGRSLRYHKASIDAWLARHHPLAAKPRANDNTPPLVPATDDEHRTFLHRHYAD